MKLYLLILVFICFVFSGVFNYYYFLIRFKLYKDIIYISKYLKNNISFNKNNISTILSNCSGNISNSTKVILNSQSEKSGIKFYKKDLKIFNDFFGSLGKGDVGFEINNINYFETLFEDSLSSAKEDVTKKGILYLKLLIGLGLIVCIVLI